MYIQAERSTQHNTYRKKSNAHRANALLLSYRVIRIKKSHCTLALWYIVMVLERSFVVGCPQSRKHFYT